MLELVGVAASGLVDSCRRSAATKSTVGNADSGGSNVVPIDVTRRSASQRQRNAGQAGISERFTARYVDARRLIETGAIKPTLDALARSVRVSQRPAKRILEMLRAEGVIEGRHYERCGAGTSLVSAARA